MQLADVFTAFRPAPELRDFVRYYDPAHFVHTFRKFTEFTPKGYARQGGSRAIYGPADEDLLHSGLIATQP